MIVLHDMVVHRIVDLVCLVVLILHVHLSISEKVNLLSVGRHLGRRVVMDAWRWIAARWLQELLMQERLRRWGHLLGHVEITLLLLLLLGMCEDVGQVSNLNRMRLTKTGLVAR